MSDTTPTAADRTVLITRVFEAPREQVFQAWTDPDELATWYGPAHMEAPRERINIDLRVGGRWELTMVRRDGGGEFSIGYEIVELVEPELLVLRSDPMPEAGMHESTIVRVELHDHGTKTRMTLTDGPLPPDGRDQAAVSWSAAIDKLAAHVDRG
ncbi:MAG TPA: SRPBCC domain-containing protein [Thermoleophilaceae bacterium]|nr:SRPBCC domain-containing protein [Thermoleophilaceae bacterium]